MGGMRREWARAATVLLVIFVALIAFGAYIGGYFLLSDPKDFQVLNRGTMTRYRHFESDWLASIYEPIGMVESTLTGMEVQIASPHPAPPP